MSSPSKVAVVTGGGGAFGSAIATRLAADGFQVAVTDANFDRASEAAALIPGAFACKLNVTDDSSVREAIAEISTRTGRIDAVVNNAGIAPPGGMTTTTLEDFDRTMSINLRGAYLVTSAAMEWLIRSGAEGRVVMIGSRTWLSGGNPAYTASKAGIVGLCRTVAQEIAASGGTCNVVAPGPVNTGFVDAMGMGETRESNFERYAAHTPMRRVATPADVAAATAFFAGPDASFITGEVLHVAGGLQLAPRL